MLSVAFLLSLFYDLIFLVFVCFSDLKVNVAGEKVNAHKFVLAARSDVWSLANMASTSELDLSGEQHPSDLTVSKEFLKLQIGIHLWSILVKQMKKRWWK